MESHGVKTTIRWPRGRDILAACGQLKSQTESKQQVITRVVS
jgi:adenine C2-methylase RlmN of 23S rRNA A2503 and tRNA A37